METPAFYQQVAGKFVTGKHYAKGSVAKTGAQKIVRQPLPSAKNSVVTVSSHQRKALPSENSRDGIGPRLDIDQAKILIETPSNQSVRKGTNIEVGVGSAGSGNTTQMNRKQSSKARGGY